MATPTRVLIVGAGGHGLIVADILLRARAEEGARRGPRARRTPGVMDITEIVEPIGFVDDDPRLTGSRVLGLEVLGTRDALSAFPHDAVIVAIGDNARREALSQELARDGARLIAACHPHASIGLGVAIGAGCMLSAGVVVTPGVRLGRGVILNTACSVDHQTIVGDFAHVGPGATIGANVTIGSRALIGLGASVMSGRRIGADTVVGAGALVTRDLPDGVVATGVPACVTSRQR